MYVMHPIKNAIEHMRKTTVSGAFRPLFRNGDEPYRESQIEAKGLSIGHPADDTLYGKNGDREQGRARPGEIVTV